MVAVVLTSLTATALTLPAQALAMSAQSRATTDDASRANFCRRFVGLAALGCWPLGAVAYDDATFKSVSTQVGGDDYKAIGENGLKYKEIRPGSGEAARLGDTVSIQFTGRCLNLNGKKFISTQDAAALSTGLAISEPFTFTIGQGSVIPGLEQAVVGMSKDQYRRVVVPQNLGYDVALTLGPTPANFEERRSLESIVKNPNRDASLLFDVKLERIKGQR